MISVRLLECLTPIIWKMDVMSVGEGPLSKKGATFRKLFTAIGGAHFKSATEIVVNNSYLITHSNALKVFNLLLLTFNNKTNIMIVKYTIDNKFRCG